MLEHAFDLGQVIAVFTTQTLQSTLKDVCTFGLQVVVIDVIQLTRSRTTRRQRARTAESSVCSLVLFIARIHNQVILLGNEFLHLFKRGTHLSGTPNQSHENFGISGISLGITNGEMIHESNDVFGLNSFNASTGGAVVKRRAYAVGIATEMALVAARERIFIDGTLKTTFKTSCSLLGGTDAWRHGVGSRHIAFILGSWRSAE